MEALLLGQVVSYMRENVMHFCSETFMCFVQ